MLNWATLKNNTSGIYKIVNIKNNKVYIGSSINLKKRLADHLSALRHNRHKNSHLQSAWNLYGEASFVIKIKITDVDPKRLKDIENWFFDVYDVMNPELGYNQCPATTSCAGYRHSLEARANMSKASKGKPKSAEHRANIAKSMLGNKNRERT